MKRRLWIVAGIVGLSLLVVGVALAFGLGNVDGVWGVAEDGNGASCDSWATGPGDSPTSISGSSTSIQTGSTTDENQARYGTGQYYFWCDDTPSTSFFAAQSGFGFDGNNNVGASLTEDVPFLLGRFTHYNNPIGASNALQWIDLDLTVTGIVCGNGQPPNEGSSLTFGYRFTLDETNNSSPCAYPGSTVCPDRVQVSAAPPAQSFTCDDPDEPAASQGVYTVEILGFQKSASSNCSTQVYDPTKLTTSFYTEEQADNHACLWAKINEFEPTAVELKSFTATAGDDGVALAWETASEVDNAGFNLWRAESVNGEKIQLNSAIIAPMNPGSPAGAEYAYLDATAVKGVAYQYWLEDVDIYGKSTLHGPVTTGGLVPAKDYPWKVFMPAVLGRH